MKKSLNLLVQLYYTHHDPVTLSTVNWGIPEIVSLRSGVSSDRRAPKSKDVQVFDF